MCRIFNSGCAVRRSNIGDGRISLAAFIEADVNPTLGRGGLQRFEGAGGGGGGGGGGGATESLWALQKRVTSTFAARYQIGDGRHIKQKKKTQCNNRQRGHLMQM